MDSNASIEMSTKCLKIALNINKCILKAVFYIKFLLQFPGVEPSKKI